MMNLIFTLGQSLIIQLLKYARDERATIIDVEDEKRYWFAISPIKDVKVKIVKTGGTEEIIEETNHEELDSK